MLKKIFYQTAIVALSFVAGSVTTNILMARDSNVLSVPTLIVYLNDKVGTYNELVNSDLSEESLRGGILDLVGVIGSEMMVSNRKPSCEESWSLYNALSAVSGGKKISDITYNDTLGEDGFTFIKTTLDDIDNCSWSKDIPDSTDGE